jgi:hypothetical protein
MSLTQTQLATVLEALRRAQGELAAYLASCDHDAELTIAKLVGILERREVVRAARLLNTLARAKAGKRGPRNAPGQGKARELTSPVPATEGLSDRTRARAIPA